MENILTRDDRIGPPFGPVDYAVVPFHTPQIPHRYRCNVCGASAVALWREYNIVLSGQRLICALCAESLNPAKRLRYGCDQVGWHVPAIPTPDGTSYWGYTSAPPEAWYWWRHLPILPRSRPLDIPENSEIRFKLISELTAPDNGHPQFEDWRAEQLANILTPIVRELIENTVS